MSYSVSAYGAMVACPVRMKAYAAALERAVRPGDVVLDLGCGTGIFSLLACRLGAAHVYAVDVSDAVQVAREVAAAAGYADRITFFQQDSTTLTLPRPADVLVSDLRGVLPLFGRHLPVLADARRRLLRPGGVLLPRRDRLFAAAVHAPAQHASVVAPSDAQALGFDFAPARRVAAATWERADFRADDLATDAACWAEIDYATADDPARDGGVELTAARDTEAHGLALWFEGEVAEGIALASRPGMPRAIYAQAFFPWPEAVALAAGDRVRVEFRARLGDGEYLFAWTTTVTGADGARRASFRQSTLPGQLPSLEVLRRSSPAHVPVLTEDGAVLREALARMDGARTLADVARDLAEAFPRRFADAAAALPAAARAAREHGR